MNLMVSNPVKYLIISILESKVFDVLNKSSKDFIVSVLWHILSIKGRINFLQLGRFSPLCEQTFRNQFEKEFDFLSFNKHLIGQVASDALIVAFDPSYIPKSGKSTHGRGKYWSGVAGAAKWGINQEYMTAPGEGKPLVKIDPAMLVTPPKEWKLDMFPLLHSRKSSIRPESNKLLDKINGTDKVT